MYIRAAMRTIQVDIVRRGCSSFPFTRLGTRASGKRRDVADVFPHVPIVPLPTAWSLVMSRYHPPLAIRAGRSDLLIYLVATTYTRTRVYTT